MLISFVAYCFIIENEEYDSVLGIKNILNLFYSFSGLSVNVEKTKFFCFGVSEGAVGLLLRNLGF